MTSRQEMEALINTYAYKIAKNVYQYCENEYLKLQNQHNKTLKENQKLKKQLKEISKTKGYSNIIMEIECKRLREYCQKLIKERDMYKDLYVKKRVRN